MFTLGNNLFIITWFLAALFITIPFAVEKWYYGIIHFLLSMLVLVLICLGIMYYNTNTASGIRDIKDTQSELNNEIEQEIIITSEDGREIFHYEGKVDIETDHNDNCIKFETEEGKRYIIYYGIQDTIKIIEK